MNLGEGHISVKRLSEFYAALHEIDRTASDLGINETALFQVIDRKLAALFPFCALPLCA